MSFCGIVFPLSPRKERGDRHSEPQSRPRTQEESATSETAAGGGGAALAAEARGWRPRWWTSGRTALGRREVEAAPRIERTSGLGALAPRHFLVLSSFLGYH